VKKLSIGILMALTLMSSSQAEEQAASYLAVQEAQGTWEALPGLATRFPYFVGEDDPALSRACHDDWNQYGEAGKIFFVAVADKSTSDVLWPRGLGQCECPNGANSCIPSCNPHIQQVQCGRKLLVRCVDNACLPEVRNKPVVVMIRDICPARHFRNQESGHCQGGNGIDLYRKLYEMMTRRGNDGPNLRLQFTALKDQNTPLGFLK
jgi:hypothetical protein